MRALQVHVVDDMNQGLTQTMVDALCQSGEIGDMIEAENEKILGNLNRAINEGYKQISFILVHGGQKKSGDGDKSRAESSSSKRPAQNESDDIADFFADGSNALLNDVFHSGVCAFCGKGEVVFKDDDEDVDEVSSSAPAKLQRCKGCRSG
jgi:hypothetical protein